MEADQCGLLEFPLDNDLGVLYVEKSSMKLRDRNLTPVGGYYYDDPLTGRPIVTDGSFQKLLDSVRSFQIAQGVTPPRNLSELIEDQICSRQPAKRCYYTKGLGDQISKVIHAVAGVVDSALKTNLQKKARRCGGCSRRRVAFNT